MADVLTFPIRGQKLSMNVEISAHVAHVKTPFQTIDIYDTEALGRLLFLDGHVQLATLDETAYHEALVHIPLLNIADPKRALVVGGGDGGVLRELVKHESLQEIHMVEIDELVVKTCAEHLPTLNCGAFNNSRVKLFFEDAFAFIKKVADPYDLVVMDVTDIYEDEEGELSENLFTEAFYQDVLAALSKQGLVVSQADNHVFCPYSMEEALVSLGRVFPSTGSFQALVPSFGGFSGYVWASNGASISEIWPDERAKSISLKFLNKLQYDLAIAGRNPGGFFRVNDATLA